MKICVPIKERDQDTALHSLQEASRCADIAEIWLDQLVEPDLDVLIKRSPMPVLAVCKRRREQGAFTGSYEAQASLLTQAMEAGAKYIDIPLFMPENVNKKIVQHARRRAVSVIISHHDFKGTPEFKKMEALTQQMKQRGADVVKLALQTECAEDGVRVVALAKQLQAEKTRHILIGMGPEGRLTRILTPTLGGEMMFAVLHKKRQTAQGQLSVEELRAAWQLIKAK